MSSESSFFFFSISSTSSFLFSPSSCSSSSSSSPFTFSISSSSFSSSSLYLPTPSRLVPLPVLPSHLSRSLFHHPLPPVPHLPGLFPHLFIQHSFITRISKAALQGD